MEQKKADPSSNVLLFLKTIKDAIKTSYVVAATILASTALMLSNIHEITSYISKCAEGLEKKVHISIDMVNEPIRRDDLEDIYFSSKLSSRQMRESLFLEKRKLKDVIGRLYITAHLSVKAEVDEIVLQNLPIDIIDVSTESCGSFMGKKVFDSDQNQLEVFQVIEYCEALPDGIELMVRVAQHQVQFEEKSVAWRDMPESRASLYLDNESYSLPEVAVAKISGYVREPVVTYVKNVEIQLLSDDEFVGIELWIDINNSTPEAQRISELTIDLASVEHFPPLVDCEAGSHVVDVVLHSERGAARMRHDEMWIAIPAKQSHTGSCNQDSVTRLQVPIPDIVIEPRSESRIPVRIRANRTASNDVASALLNVESAFSENTESALNGIHFGFSKLCLGRVSVALSGQAPSILVSDRFYDLDAFSC